MNWRMRYGRNWGLLDMRYNVNIKKLSEVADLTVGFVGSMAKHYVDEGVPFLRSTNIRRFKIDMSDIKYISPEFNEKIKKSQLREGDVVIVRTGMPGACTVILKEQEGWNCSDLVIIHPHKEKVLPLYIAAYVNYSTGIINANLVGAVQQHFNVGSAKNMEIAVPSIEIQKKIVGIIQNINEKLDINSRINKNLEQQALALFKQYFMDYAPYVGIASAEWREFSLDDVCTKITDGSHYSPADSPDSPYPMYSVKDMETYGFNSSSCKHITKEDFYKMQKNDCIPLLNDILVAKDGSYLKEIFICSEQKDEAILSSIAIFRPDTQIVIPEILLYLLKQPSVRKDVGDNYVSGSALPRIVLKDFKKYRFMLPPLEEQQKIGSVLHAIRMQIKTNVDEIHCLSSLRDTLLPKLMSGELDVSNLDI